MPRVSKELIAPATEVAGVDVEDDRDEAADVVDGDRLGVQIQEGSSLLKEHGGVEVHRSMGTRSRGAWRG